LDWRALRPVDLPQWGNAMNEGVGSRQPMEVICSVKAMRLFRLGLFAVFLVGAVGCENDSVVSCAAPGGSGEGGAGGPSAGGAGGVGGAGGTATGGAGGEGAAGGAGGSGGVGGTGGSAQGGAGGLDERFNDLSRWRPVDIEGAFEFEQLMEGDMEKLPFQPLRWEANCGPHCESAFLNPEPGVEAYTATLSTVRDEEGISVYVA